jgi:hypothetical protein
MVYLQEKKEHQKYNNYISREREEREGLRYINILSRGALINILLRYNINRKKITHSKSTYIKIK